MSGARQPAGAAWTEGRAVHGRGGGGGGGGGGGWGAAGVSSNVRSAPTGRRGMDGRPAHQTSRQERMRMKPPEIIRLTPGKRVLFLTKDPDLIRRQLRGELDLRMEDLSVDDLLDDINTDAMTPAWVCFSHRPEDIARDAYAGLIVDGHRLFERDALINGNFEVIVSGYRKGVGSSRETAVQAEKWSGIRIAIAASFAPIHARNNISQGVLMGNHEQMQRLQAGGGAPP